MNMSEFTSIIRNFYNVLYDSDLPNYVIFLIFLLGSLAIGRYTPSIVRIIIHRVSPQQVTTIYDNFIEPLQQPFRLAGTFLLISLSLVWLRDYPSLYQFLTPFVNLGVIVSVAWLISRIFRQVVRIYGIDLLRRWGRSGDEFLLVIETLVNVIIGFFAALVYANSLQINLIGLMASLGIGGLAVAFAAQKILEQLLSTIVLYLDRPFVPGDYIRLQNGELGRVESIGLRSTKIRTSAKSTLFIVPNSTLISMEIENLTRAKKVMVLLYLDFYRLLEEREHALVQQTIKESTNSVYGIDPGSTKIAFNDNFLKRNSEGFEKVTTQARVTFFILGSSENSIELRKRLLELANNTMSKKLKAFGIDFTMQDPTIYVESPITL
ncbi:mechanosensitive ion channel family protein [Phormidium sp. CCY1219]|uniref:mechanosensitive ion channel family protein n=1 Tax=Phormidium sp. CCY1219 TaxID=2886104 RepID=UPI002D1E6735|nr:mechanosensitive ion channel domain-containing protein [Phormidium sp. CCY1219]MEB3828795.1 mechanosensitive ion channel family protein [Phormidium sp. CCY1219]